MARTGEKALTARPVQSAKRFPLNYSMNVGKGEVTFEEGSPPHIDGRVNEHAQLWFYRSWSHWMAAESWDELKATHPSIDEDYV